MITKIKFDEFDGHVWFMIESDDPRCGVLQVDSGVVYNSVAMRDDDPHTYEECYLESDSSESDPS